MIKYLKILFLGMVVIGLMALPAMAVDLSNKDGGSFPTGTGTANAYKIAYEAYSNAAGVSTIADDLIHKGGIRVTLTSTILAGDNVDLKISNGTAKFVSAGPTFKFGLCDPTVNAGGCLPGAASLGGIVGVVNGSGLTTDDLGFQITTSLVITPGNTATLWVIQWDDAASLNNQIDTAAEGSSIKDGVGLSVNAGLTSQGCDSLPSFIKIVFTTPHESTQTAKNFAYITQEFSGCGTPAADAISAELDTDTDFASFVLGSGSNSSFLRPHFIKVGSNGTPFLQICDGAILGTGAPDSMWIAFVQGTVPTGTITFDVISSVPEPCPAIEYNEIECTTSDDITFHCSSGNVSVVGIYFLEVELESSSCSNDPTGWKLANVNIGGNLCVFPGNQNLGVWSGGLEAFVPFVKGIPTGGYSTVIKLFNRYDKDAKLFVSTFADVAGGSDAPTMISTAQLDSPLDFIPAGEFVMITDQDIRNFLINKKGYSNSAADTIIANGIPVKFNIRVPSQTGTENTGGTISFGPPTFSGTETRLNPKDPFVEGVVISNYPNGGQRAIALKFKSFKNGEYNF